ncbi:MAG: glycosyltransferase family A protein [Planctomycetota bacterium]
MPVAPPPPPAAPADPAHADGPLFTVSIPVYNRADMVEATLKSVYDQSFTDYEIVAVNDGSKDNSLDVIRAHEPRIRVVDQANQGLAGARNTGAQHARGRYIVYLDSDDLFHPWSLATLAELIETWRTDHDGRDPAIVSGEFTPFAEDGAFDGASASRLEHLAFDSFLISGNRRSIAPSATALHLPTLRHHGLGEQVRVMFEEVDLWLKVGQHEGFLFATKPSICGYRVGHASMMGNMQKQLDGYAWIRGRVEAGAYGDDPGLKDQMREVLGVYAKGAALRCLHTKDRARGLAFFKHALPTVVKRGDLKFAAAYPLLLAAGRGVKARSMRGLQAQTIADE